MKHDLRIAVMAIIVNGDKVLIGSSPRDGGYKFPQGGLELGESAHDGIIRELYEELNTIIKPTDILAIYDEKVTYTYPNEERYIFKRQELHIVKINFNPKMKFEPQDDEFDQLHWIYPTDLKNYNSYFRAKAYEKALEICGLL